MSDTPAVETDVEIPKPSDHLTVRVNGEDRRVFMSFGLLRRVAQMIGGFSFGDGNIGSFLLEGDRMAALVDLMLDHKNFKIDAIKDYEISHEDALTLSKWGLQHALRFFAENLRGLQEVTQDTAPILANLMRSVDGSTPSP